LLTALVVGTAPVWLSTRQAVFDGLRKGGRGTSDRSQPRLRQGLVAAELALALVLLAGGGLFLRGLQRFVAADPGGQADSLLTGRIQLTGARYDNPDARATAMRRIQQALSSLPGVASVAVADWLPITTRGSRHEFRVEGAAPRPAGQAPTMYSNLVSPEYFATIGIALREGRLFGGADVSGAAPAAIINETMARNLWPGHSALGKRLAFVEDNANSRWYWKSVVGVVADVQYRSSIEDPKSRYQAYFPLWQWPSRNIKVALRTHGDPQMLVSGLRQAVAGVDPQLIVYEPLAARALMDRYLANFFLAGWVMFGFAGLGLLISGLGVYGLFAGFVVERTREIGVRMALGAQSDQVVAMVMRKGVRIAIVGAGLGALGALVVVTVLRSIAFELPAPEPGIVVLLPLLLIAVALFACWLPARRAAAVDPMVALRQE
jgi:putative ABC transport system permease protein